MVKLLVILGALIGLALCEPPVSYYGAPAYAPVHSGGYAPTNLLALSDSLAPGSLLLAAPQIHTLALAPAHHAPPIYNLNAGFATEFGLGGPSLAPVAHVKPVVKVVKKAPVFVKSYNYDHAPFKPIVKKPVYGPPAYSGHHHHHHHHDHGYGSSISITPSISYGYSYKLVPTSHYGPAVSHLPKKIHGGYGGGKGKTFDLDLGFQLGHH